MLPKPIFGTELRPPGNENTKLLNAYLDLVFADKWAEQAATGTFPPEIRHQHTGQKLGAGLAQHHRRLPWWRGF